MFLPNKGEMQRGVEQISIGEKKGGNHDYIYINGINFGNQFH